ncbi:hypothetical protein N0V90_009226 [Kalmusia sp. IMI 367209]|nr:hypothetical protein N0V90_009226 [Kalmusia sp. IMI 367209]
MASTQGGNFDFNAGAGIDFTGFGMQPAAYNDLKGSTGEGNTSSTSFFFGDEGIDTTGTSFDHSFDSIFAPVGDLNSTAFGMEPLGLDNTAGSASWGNTFPTTPAQSFESLYTAPQYNSLSKRPLQLEVQDYPQAKRHEAFSPFSTTASITASSSNWALETQPTPAASSDVGLSDEAADVCATWFSKYNVLPRHIDSLSQLTGESSTAIRQWFGQALKQGMNGQDSAYKSQTGFTQDPLFSQLPQTTTGIASQQLAISDVSCNHDTQAATTVSPLRGGKKGCNPTDDPELLKRDPNKIYQCTRKCGLCHFRNIHPGLNCGDYEETSVVHSDTSLPQAARKCGFCSHQFVSRQDRIDHIAEHFKDGKCMLDWSDDENENNDSDNMDDDDDRPDSGGGFGNGKDFFPPSDNPRDPGQKHNGDGNDGNGGNDFGPQSGFFQFQVSRFADSDTRGSSPGVEQVEQNGSQHIQPLGNQHIKPASALDSGDQDSRDATTTTEYRATCSIHDIQRSMHGRHEKTKEHDSQTLAGNALSLNETDRLELQTIPPYVPPNDRDPAPDQQDQVEGDHDQRVTDGVTPRCTIQRRESTDHARSRSLTRETESLLGSLKLLGTGGFSTVDEVVHRETSLHFARKTLKNRERSALEELKNEVDVLQKLRHPHIIRFVDSVQKGDRMSILLAPVAETTLASWLDTNTHNRPEGLSRTIVNMLGCLASSIRYLHEQRPVVKHMDIKPQNILVMQGSQEFPHVILSDFGVSSIGELTADGKTMPLTRQYCAPEVSEGISRELASDIWSLGCVFVEMAIVAFREDNPHWLNFRKQFGGRKGKYYWQDVSGLQGLLSQSLDRATTQTEANVTRTVKEMLSSEPAQRPTAPKLTMVFTPAPCCLSWPNEQAAYPGPQEELQTVKTLFQQDDGVGDCAHICGDAPEEKQHIDPVAHAKRWLEECSHDHEACRHEPSGLAGKTLPTRLVDILPDGKEGVSVRIVDGAALGGAVGQDYAAVSYMWTDQEITLSTSRLAEMQADLPRETLPKAINEAIAKAQDIGFRYIWIDSLCVLQDSEEDKERECRATADVYRNAALTIVLDQLNANQTVLDKIDSSSRSGSSLCTTPKKGEHLTLSASLPLITFLTPGFAWDTRAWSLQERLLSHRFLHIGQEQMYWECNALKASETFPRGLESFRNTLSSLLWEKVHTRHSTVSLDTPSHDLKHTTFDVEGTGTGKVDPCSCGLKQDEKPSLLNFNDVSPHLLRDCQYIRKEGDGIGDSMEAAHMQLTLLTTTTKLRAELNHDHALVCIQCDHAHHNPQPSSSKAALPRNQEKQFETCQNPPFGNNSRTRRDTGRLDCESDMDTLCDIKEATGLADYEMATANGVSKCSKDALLKEQHHLRDCVMGGTVDCDRNMDTRANGIGDEDVYGKNRGVRVFKQGDGNDGANSAMG